MDYKAAVALVKDAYDIADYIRSSGIQLQANGAGKWKACCPFHSEKTPSFVVNETFQYFKCFGCGKAGDILTFAQDHENFTFREALLSLARDKNIELELDDATGGVDYESLYKILKIAANFYCKEFNGLADNHPAKKEILSRGLTFNNGDKVGLKYGYAPSGGKLTKYLQEKGFSNELLAMAGVSRIGSNGSAFDFFPSRLMFIFTDRYGKPIGFSSRKLYEDDKMPGKYVNSADGPLFHKSRVFYNHLNARLTSGKAKAIYITEGQFDVAAFMSAGLLNVVATSGTAFTRDHAAECLKLVGPSGRLYFCFDGDKAGIEAASRVFMNLPEVHESAHVVLFPEDTDPCDYRQDNGNEALREYVKVSMPLVEFMIKNCKKNHDLSSVTGTSKYINEAASIIKTISNLTLRNSAMSLLSLESLSPLDAIREAVDRAAPLVLNAQREYVHQESEAPEDAEDAIKEAIEDVDYRELMSNDILYSTAFHFTAIGLLRQSWRKSLVRSKNILPKELHSFLDELDALSEKDKIFPELFTNSKLAEFLMDEEFSSFAKFMDVKELKEHFIFLHQKLQRMIAERKKLRRNQQLLGLLSSDKEKSFDYYKSVLEKSGLN